MSGDGASVPWEQAIALLSDFNSQAEKQMPFEALPKSQNVIWQSGFQGVIHKQHY